ncbi:MAG: hypothetical protein RJB13_188 [Pseudomonadota bacterium]
MKAVFLGICTVVAVTLISCGDKPTGDVIVALLGKTAGESATTSGDAGSGGTRASGTGTSGTAASADGICKPAFSFAEAQQRCASCHSSAGGNAKWSGADGSEADWKAFASEIRASVETDYMPLGKFEPADKEKFLAYMDGLTGSCTPATETGGGGTSDQSDPNIMSLSEAKAQCAGCHVANGPGAKWWDKADGSEEDWRAAAPALLAAVENGISSLNQMPPSGFTGNNQVRFVNFIKKLRDNQSNTPITYSLETAKPLCVGCHNGTRAAKGVNLELLATWRNNQDVADEVNKGDMPENFRLNPQEKAALLRFINNL